MNHSIVIVITPSFNAERFLDEAIFSVISQRGDFKLRYHVQDGGSSDNTVKILRQWEERLAHGNPIGGAEVEFSWQSISDTGMYDAINRGFSYVLSQIEIGPKNDPVLTWINADDILLPNAIQTVNDYFCKNVESKWVTGMSSIMNESGILAQTWHKPRGYAQSSLALGKHDGRTLPFLQQEGTFFSLSLWSRVGGVSKEFCLAGDWDLWRRFAVCEEVIKLSCVLAVHRRHSGQLSEDMTLYFQEIDSAEHVDARSIDLNDNALSANFDTNTGVWQKYLISFEELRYEMTSSKFLLQTGGCIDFSLPKFPSWVVCVSGMSGVESFGRWSDVNLAKSVRIVFNSTFPKRFQLNLNMRAINEDISPVTISVGFNHYQINVTEQLAEIRLNIDNPYGANAIDILPSKTFSPLEMGWGSDDRQLGLAIASMSFDFISESE